jgi:signal transduction histidine kinase
MPDRYASAHLLIVDDNAAAAKTLRLVLKSEGYEVDCAGEASEALRMALQAPYDAALVDIGLPGRSGIDLLTELKAKFPDLVVIMVTGRASTESSIQALNQGASGYVQKPVDIRHLMALLEGALERKRLQEENWLMLRRLSLLHAVGAEVSVGLRPETTLRESMNVIVSLLDLAGGAIWWHGAGDGLPPLATSVGLPESVVADLTPQVADLQIQVAIDRDLRYRPWFDAQEIVDGDGGPWSLRLIPLRGHDRLAGFMAIGGHPDQMRAAVQEAEVLGAVATQIGVAMENMRLYDDLRVALERLQQAQAQIVQAEKLSAVGRVVSGVAHELNNPLMVVLGYADLLREGVEPPEVPSIAERIYAQTERAGRIIQQLLAFSRQERTVLRPTDLRPVIHAALESTARLRGSRVHVVLALPDTLPTTAADPGGLQQVLSNILGNAAQAMGEAGGALTVAAHVAEDTITLTISDTGPGIPDDVLPRIFDPFFTTKGVGQGTGLGLSVSHGIVRDHGGEIVATNSPQGGAVFTIHLPIREVEPPADNAADPIAQDAPWLAATGGRQPCRQTTATGQGE